MFITDRDLLVLEPNLFRDVGWLGQRVLDSTCSIAGTTLTVPGAVDLAALGVTTGHVILVNGLPLEVLARPSSTTLTVSKVRADTADAAIAPGSAPGGTPAQVWTFRPQIALVHAQVLRLLGVEPAGGGFSGSAFDGQLVESQIIRGRSLWVLEALLALHQIYSAAAGLSGGAGSSAGRSPATSTPSPLAERAEMYRRRAALERTRAVAYLDTNNDGVAEIARYVGVACWTRG